METVVTVLLSIVFGIPLLFAFIELVRLFFVGVCEIWRNIIKGPADSADSTFLERYRERNHIN
jgi:hypothetical protein